MGSKCQGAQHIVLKCWCRFKTMCFIVMNLCKCVQHIIVQINTCLKPSLARSKVAHACLMTSCTYIKCVVLTDVLKLWIFL